jgi:hypothetical protein
MDLIAKASGGKNIVARPQARAPWYPDKTINPATVAVYWRYEDEPPAAARLIGHYRPGEESSFHHNPLIDKNIYLGTISIAPDGTPGVRELAHANWQLVTSQRETAAPVIGQFNDATADSVTVSITNFSMLVTKRRLRIAEALTGGGALDSPTEQLFMYGPNEAPKFIEISRAGAFAPTVTYEGNDPTAHGFALTGSGTVEMNAGGWRINTLTTDAATYYTKSSWPAGAFTNGFTLELTAPIVTSSDNASPADCICLQVEDGSHRYKLQFDASGNVALNGGTPHAIGGARIRLVVDIGGAHADLWIGDTQVETATAAAATSTSGLKFGDLDTTDDADAVWPGFSYQLSHVPVRLAATLYVAVAHSSGGDWTPDSNILEITFANDTSGDGGSTGDLDPTPKDTYDVS